MLISFTLENFKSFQDRTTLSLMARKSDRTLPGALIGQERGATSKHRLLPAVAIYGSNASGKTNLLLGLAYMRQAVLSSQSAWKSGTGTRVDPNASSTKRPSFFEVSFQTGGILYRYGFRTRLTHFEEEWLYSYPLGRERLLFKRTAKSVAKNGSELTAEYELETGPKLSGDKREHESSFRRTRENSLLLSSLSQDNQVESLRIEKWFRDRFITEIKLNVAAFDQGATSKLAHDHKNFKALLLPLLRAADPCISDIVIRKTPDDGEDANDALEDARRHKVSFVVVHNGKKAEIPFEKQSRGIKRLYALSAGMITALKFGKVCIVDELETSMHPHVASQLLALFQNKASNPKGAQLIFSTHETRLLNLQHLRRDQIWFCERDMEGLSSLFSLIEFSPRKDENFESGYLKGRYGAVPPAGIDPTWLTAINDKRLTIISEDDNG
ncbi:ATP/GTP-binding protein [uncultured Sphingomonas sp.]|uniref:AAA family ATPase n=1 Tax=uncultured Sphingomonas sp. TaxID=158754 RepID=UPI0035C9C029